LADPNRLRLFAALRDKERCVSDLVASEGIPQPLVSHHLRVMSRAGLVQARRAEGFTFYTVDPAGMATALKATTALLDPDTVSALARPGGNAQCCR
jgi:ArsR family transcriptional regulator